MIPLRDSQPSKRFPLITVLLILANIYVYYLEVTSPNLDQFFRHYALIPALVDVNDPRTFLPFVTAIFLHGGLFHIASNMWFLWIFGDNVEERFGGLYIIVYLLGGIIGNIAQYVLMPHSSTPIVGASGAIATVLGAYFVFFPGHTVLTLVPIFFFFTILNIPAFAILALWFVTQLLNGTAAIGDTVANTGGGVAYFAHIAGFISGIVIALLFDEAEYSTSQ